MTKDVRTIETDNGYENKARRIALKLGLRVHVVEGNTACPSWTPGGRLCDHAMHGQHYRVTLRWRRHAGPTPSTSTTFSFWGSKHDQERGIEPGYYDVLACVNSEAHCPTDPDEIVGEFGPMLPSRATAIAKHAARLNEFLGARALQALEEIT